MNNNEYLKVVPTEVITFATELTCLLQGDPVVNFIMWRLKRKYSGNDIMQMSECPRFKAKACEAALCPLDPNLIKCAHLKGERVCFYVRESVKQSFKPDIFTTDDNEKEILDAVQHSTDLMKMIGKRNYINKLERAAESSSKRYTNNLKMKKD